MQKITPHLWFDAHTEQAVNGYLDAFGHSRLIRMNRFVDGPAKGNANAEFELEGREFKALDGGPHFRLTPAISFFVDCQTQDEVDELWARLSDGGAVEQCGWLRDRFGVSWQIVPSVLGELLNDPETEKSRRVMQAMLQMVKLDIKELVRAYEQG